MPAALSGPLLSLEYLRGVSASAAPGASPAAISRFRALRARCRLALGPASPPAAVLSIAARPLIAWLGWPLPAAAAAQAGQALLCRLLAARIEPVALLVVPWGRAERPGRHAIGDALAAGCRWLLLTDGRVLRLVDGARAESRAFLAFDLDACADDAESLAWLGRLAGPGAFAEPEPPLTRWLRDSDEYGRRVCGALRAGVGDALAAFTEAVARAPGGRARDLTACYADALVAVYRVLFLLFAEARHLVPMWHPAYRRGYSVDALRARLADGRSPRGAWAALQAMARLAHAGVEAGDLRVTAFNGRLFAPARAPLLDHLALDDVRVARALDRLCFTRPGTGGARQRIAYAELGVEELGAVYESLLDLEPEVERPRPAARDAPPVIRLRTSASAARKTTGTFYTPRALADALVRETLAPLVEGRRPEEILALRVLDPAMGSGAFLVSAGRYLAEQWEAAVVAAGDAAPGDLSDADRAATRRAIASRCLFGVDRNPMAVQLAQLSLWLATLSSDRPLSFLDHHLVAGNSLIGASPLDVLARPPGGRPRPGPLPLDALFDWAAALSSVRARRHAIESTPDDTAEAVRGKESALAEVSSSGGLTRWLAACDLWCACWTPGGVGRGVYHALRDRILAGAPVNDAVGAEGRRLAARARALACVHWPLQFPEVFLDADGRPRLDAGFDAVVGNPPWEMLRGDRDRAPGARDDGAAILRFARDAGLYTAQGRGHANQFQLFVERALHVTRPGGRVGLLVPSGLLTDEGNAPLRRALVLANELSSVTVFDNRRGLFPIHRSLRFAAVTIRRHGRTDAIRCRFGVTDAAGGRVAPETVTVTPGLLERLSGPGLALPDLPGKTDVRLVERLCGAHPRLGAHDGWHVTFGRELNATDDRDCFRAGPPQAGDLPVVEGRHLAPFQVGLAGVTRFADPARVRRRLGGRAAIDRPRLAYRDVASASNRVTLIAAILPAGVVSVHTVFCAHGPMPPGDQRVLCALLNSYVANYLVRRRVTTHVTAAIVAALPVPVRARDRDWFEELDAAAQALLAGRAAGDAHARAQALAAAAYGLDEAELRHVLETFPLVPREDRGAVVDAFTDRRPRRSWR